MNFHRKPCQNLNFYSNYLSRINKSTQPTSNNLSRLNKMEHSKNISFEVDEKIYVNQRTFWFQIFFIFKFIIQVKLNVIYIHKKNKKRLGDFIEREAKKKIFR